MSRNYIWESSPVVVYLSATLNEALTAIAKDMGELLETHREVTLDIYTGKNNLEHLNLTAYQFAPGVRVTPREAAPDSEFSRYPRAEVTLYGTTWAGQDDNGDFLSWRDIHQFWEISACPPGMDPRVHHTAETLLWDAHEQAHDLDLDTAIAIAQALFPEDTAPPRA